MPRHWHWHWQLVAGVVLGLAGPAVLAQSTTAAADEEAMARARRQAENPLRRILEAGRITIRRRVPAEATEAGASPPAEPGMAAAAGRVQVSGAASAASTPSAAAALSTPAEPSPAAIRVTVEPMLPAVTEPPLPGASRALPLPTSTPTNQRPVATPAQVNASLRLPPAVPSKGGPDRDQTARQSASGAAAPQQAPVYKTMEWAPDPLPAPAGPATSSRPEPVETAVLDNMPAPSMSLPASPALNSFVEPVLTDRLRDELGRIDVVTVELALSADGSVHDAVVLTRVPAGVRRALESALLQWRYNALPGPATHRVELAFER